MARDRYRRLDSSARTRPFRYSSGVLDCKLSYRGRETKNNHRCIQVTKFSELEGTACFSSAHSSRYKSHRVKWTLVRNWIAEKLSPQSVRDKLTPAMINRDEAKMKINDSYLKHQFSRRVFETMFGRETSRRSWGTIRENWYTCWT